MSWRDLEEGGVVKGGTASKYVVAGWRVKRPVVDESRCTNCLICWIYCPEPAIIRREGAKIAIDLDHCKGCGICETECPPKAIRMVMEP